MPTSNPPPKFQRISAVGVFTTKIERSHAHPPCSPRPSSTPVVAIETWNGPAPPRHRLPCASCTPGAPSDRGTAQRPSCFAVTVAPDVTNPRVAHWPSASPPSRAHPAHPVLIQAVVRTAHLSTCVQPQCLTHLLPSLHPLPSSLAPPPGLEKIELPVGPLSCTQACCVTAT